jgi:hypothetical protein
MGSRGPIPKRDAERRRRNQLETATETIVVDRQVRIPQADSSWCSRAKRLWKAAKASPVSDYYLDSDWQMLAYACDLITTLFRPGRLSPKLDAAVRAAAGEMGLSKDERLYLEWMLAPPRPSAQMVASLNSVMVSLGLTEGDRRRMRIEIERRPKEKPPEVTDMDEYRQARQG